MVWGKEDVLDGVGGISRGCAIAERVGDILLCETFKQWVGEWSEATYDLQGSG